jgi:hypothetical protein
MRALAVAAVLHLSGGCMKKSHHDVWLALGGVHELGISACKLQRMEPAGALEDLKWQGGALVMRARAEGIAEFECGDDRFTYHVARAASLQVIVSEPVEAGAHFDVRAVPRDAGGRQLDIGKWAEVEWSSEGDVASDNDRSAAEFGLCDTCFGAQGFRAGAAGKARVRATFEGVAGELDVLIL